MSGLSVSIFALAPETRLATSGSEGTAVAHVFVGRFCLYRPVVLVVSPQGDDLCAAGCDFGSP